MSRIGIGVEQIATPAAEASNRSVSKAWFFAVLSFAIFGTQNAVFMLPPILVEIALDLRISVAVAGQLVTATFAAWAVSLIMAGPLSDSFGRRPVILGGLLMLVASVVASAFAPNIEVFLALRVLTGLAAGMIPPTSVGVLSDVISPERRAQAVSSFLAIGILTSAVSVPLALGLADFGEASFGGWRFAFFIAGLLLAAGFISNWLWFPRDSRERVRSWAFFSRYWSLVSRPFFQTAVAVGMSQRIAFWTMVSYFAAYLRDTYELSVGYAALPLGIVAVGQAVGSFLGGLVAMKPYRALLIGATSAAGGVCAFLCFTVELELWAAAAVATVGGGLLAVAMPALVAASTEPSGESKSTGASILGLSNQIGGMLGAAIAGALLASAGYGGIGYMCLGVTIASALMAAFFGRNLRQGAE